MAIGSAFGFYLPDPWVLENLMLSQVLHEQDHY